jgi:short subunit dehydrogenase-like uncharacterized protein
MAYNFLLYGANGYVGAAISRMAIREGLKPILAGRTPEKIEPLAKELGLEIRVSSLNDPTSMDRLLQDVRVVLHCAGPYLYTSKQMVDACLRAGAHYLDLTGEIPVFEAISARDAEAKARGVMLLPGVGFDVVPTDCLAVYLKQQLPSATHLTLAFFSQGPGGLPPGTQRTSIELIPYGNRMRRGGRLEAPEPGLKTRMLDFGTGPMLATRLTWGDVFTAYYSTGIPNIEDYAVLPESTRKQLALGDHLRPLFRLAPIRSLMKRAVRPGPSAERRARTFTHVWGQVRNDESEYTARLHGPEAGVEWTGRAALGAVKKVLNGISPSGYQTPGMAFGADFVLECEGVTREDIR